MPPIGRRGFRDWHEVLGDLAAIENAVSPLNRARVWMSIPSANAVAPVGALAVEASDGAAVLRIDGTDVARLERAAFRGGWLWLNGDHYYLDLDVGTGWDNIQVSGPGDLPDSTRL